MGSCGGDSHEYHSRMYIREFWPQLQSANDAMARVYSALFTNTGQKSLKRRQETCSPHGSLDGMRVCLRRHNSVMLPAKSGSTSWLQLAISTS